MKSLIKSAFVLAAVSLMASPLLTGCNQGTESEASDSAVGSLGLNLQISDGVDLSTVHYEITRVSDSVVVRAGDLNVANASSLSFRIGRLPAGQYELALSASTADSSVSCSGSATFTIVAGQVVTAQVTLNCGTPNNVGDVDVNADLNSCPFISYIITYPLSANEGEAITVESEGDDLNASDVLSYSWKVDGVEFATTANAAFICGGTADHVLEVTVADGNCTGSDSVNVHCEGVSVCGDGNIEGTEQCDDGNLENFDACPADCQNAVCGDGVHEGLEACDEGGDTANCTAACAIRPVVCGDGWVQGGEACDDGNNNDNDACRNDCTAGAVCGNGIVEAPEACDDGNQVNDDACKNDCTVNAGVCGDGNITGTEECDPGQSSSPFCDAQCMFNTSGAYGVSPACNSCVEANCNNDVAGFDAPGLCPAGSDCANFVASCFAQNSCLSSTVGAATCLCGTVTDLGDCVDSSRGQDPNGACYQAYLTAFGVTRPDDISPIFTNLGFPAGVANQVGQCMGDFCLDECFPE